MPAAPRRQLSRASLLLLLAVDLIALSALVMNQWLGLARGWSWLLGTVLGLALLPVLLRLVDRVLAAARAARNIPIAGGTFP
ncbi:MAG TPA: hypothetical protein PLS34_05030 [Gammaproteobacteria bacterium]|nr:hypothetical protein [Gammaproteobacteria bacterium]